MQEVCGSGVEMEACLSAGEHIGCPFATQEESGFEDELPAFSFLSFDPIMVAEQFTLMDAVSTFPFLFTAPCNIFMWFPSRKEMLKVSCK